MISYYLWGQNSWILITLLLLFLFSNIGHHVVASKEHKMQVHLHWFGLALQSVHIFAASFQGWVVFSFSTPLPPFVFLTSKIHTTTKITFENINQGLSGTYYMHTQDFKSRNIPFGRWWPWFTSRTSWPILAPSFMTPEQNNERIKYLLKYVNISLTSPNTCMASFYLLDICWLFVI